MEPFQGKLPKKKKERKEHMKIHEAITEMGNMIPDHNVSEDLLFTWLSRIEGLVVAEIHRGKSANTKYTKEHNEVSLIVPDPYSVIYPLYLQTMAYLYLGEYDRYNHLNSVFNNAWSDYAKYHIRNNK